MTLRERASAVRPSRFLLPATILALLMISSLGVAPFHDSTAVGPARPAAPGSGAVVESGPLQPCTGGNPGFSTVFSLGSPSTNGSWNASQWTVGPAPVAASFYLTVWGGTIGYTADINWGDGTQTAAAFNLSAAGQNFTFNHTFSLPAIYTTVATTNYTCSAGPGWNVSDSISRWGQLTVYGPGGPNPINVTANLSSAPVPAFVAYNATVAGAAVPVMIAYWTLSCSGTTLTFNQSVGLWPYNSSVYSPELTVPGTWTGAVQVRYPGSGLLYAQADTPVVIVTPLAQLVITNSAVIGSSPWNVTYTGLAYNLTGGGLYNGSYTDNWSFYDTSGILGYPYNWAYGPTAGISVWREYYFNSTGSWYVGVFAAVVRADGVTLAVEYITIGLWNPPPFSGVTVGLSVTPNNGTAPLNFNLTAWVSGGNTSLGPLGLGGFVYLFGGGTVWTFNSSTNATWGYQVNNWSGAPLTIPGVPLTTAGTYRVAIGVFQTGGGMWTWLGSANATVVVRPAVGSSPPVLSFTAAPANGSAPLNLTLIVLASGGSTPYSLSACMEGPFALPNGTGPCTSVGSASLWNGSAMTFVVALNTSGNYTLLASLTDSAGAMSNASASVVVGPFAPVPPLSVHASYSAPSGVTQEGATYGFLTTISGGTAPFNVQWTYGDGSSGSSIPGVTVTHTYTASGVYNVLLTVTDARGVAAHASVGPLIVSVPLAAPAALPWWATTSVVGVALAVVLASLAVLGWTVLRLARRKEALNWFRDLETAREPDGPRTGPR